MYFVVNCWYLYILVIVGIILLWMWVIVC